MTEDVMATEGQEPTKPQQVQATQTAQEPAAQAAKAALSVDAYEAELKKVRDEAAKSRIERKELAAKVAAYEAREESEAAAKLSEVEKSQKAQEKLAGELAKYQADLAAEKVARQALTLKTAVMEAAPKAGIAHPGAAVKLLDPTTLELNDDGTPKNLDDVLKGLLKEYPFLGAGPVITATNPSRSESQAGATEEARERYIRAKVFGQPDSMFNVKRARAEGGGVVIRDEK